LYASTNSIPERDVTITVVSTAYPKDVTKHIQSEWGGRLSAEDMSAALSASMALKGKTRLGVYIEAIASANPDVVLEVNKNMTNRMRQLLIDIGYAAEWQAAAREAGKLEGLRDAAQRMLKGGISIEDVTRYTGLPREQFS
ncbi:MAG: hypothetical protein LBR38_02165, partial [Synergistaceae bacterium]|nr:hypothetical protein [Synergistaceae bacterium]